MKVRNLVIEEVDVVVMTVEGRRKEEKKRKRYRILRIADVLVHVGNVRQGVHVVVLQGVHALALQGAVALQGVHAVVLHGGRPHVAPLQPQRNSQWTARKVEV